MQQAIESEDPPELRFQRAVLWRRGSCEFICQSSIKRNNLRGSGSGLPILVSGTLDFSKIRPTSSLVRIFLLSVGLPQDPFGIFQKRASCLVTGHGLPSPSNQGDGQSIPQGPFLFKVSTQVGRSSFWKLTAFIKKKKNGSWENCPRTGILSLVARCWHVQDFFGRLAFSL